MKRLPQCLLALLLLMNFPAWAVDIFVATNGSDLNEGSKEKPLATVAAALRKARNLRRLNDESIKNGIHIILRGGNYQILETIVIKPEDGGTWESVTYIEAAENEQPVLSGGVPISNWKKLTAAVNGLQKNIQSKIWVADVPLVNGGLFNSRQLWVNNTKATRAKSANGETMHRILNWNKQEAACVIPTLAFQNLDKEKGVELFIHQWWEIANLRIKKMQVMGDSTKVFFEQPESKIQNEHPWPAPWLSAATGNSAFYLTNAIQFLDEPGEWYLDAANKKLYYWPRVGENLATAKVLAPFTETLISVQGTIDAPVTNLVIEGISFQHTGWLRPSQQGHVPHQAGMFMTEAYKLRPVGTKENPTLDNQAWIGRQNAAIEVNYGVKILINNCNFQKLAATAIDIKIGTKQATIKNNLFRDIGGSAIVAGNFGDEGREIHLPYNSFNKNALCEHVTVQNNFTTNTANEDWGCAAMTFGILTNTKIQHNEIENTSYSGISFGWGWNDKDNGVWENYIQQNYIHHFGKHNYDCGGVYTLGNQGGLYIEENVIDSIYKAPYAHLPSHWFYLYADEGTSGTEFVSNWTPTTKYLQNRNGKGNWWYENGPINNDSVKLDAGLQKDFIYLKKYSTVKNVKQAINEEHNEVIELVVKEGQQLDLQKLKLLLVKNNMDSSAIYHWQNHYVLFSRVQDLGVMEGRLQNNFPEATVKAYHNMFYEYSKKKHCADKTTAKEWTHILLTANLVADKKLQQEYLDYHNTQFEKWPDIAKGFCNADFQQLLIFKNGRQLVLIISIPKGKTLDELNPKTTEHNPKMNEWNTIMGKYQEGIEGTKKGESWVFLKLLSQ